MKEYILDDEKYFFDGKRWLDEARLAVPTSIESKLNRLLTKDIDFQTMSYEELLHFASDIKESENYQLAIRALEILLERGNKTKLKMILPRLTACYRQVGKSEQAIKMGRHYIEAYGEEAKSAALYTSMAAAACDADDFLLARKYANTARAMSGKEPSAELINTYFRIKKHDGGVDLSEECYYVQRNKATESGAQEQSKERKALIAIWHSLSQEQKDKNKDNFQMISDLLR